ncbi:serine/threonine protein kinase [Thalassotalea ponticola]|uniref:serine/threonine protein kinase n=1 Tax=Thalassotalea ponticola TaxID=1523392 RepID=UPI0025B5EDF5|nr:serine/threonine protein kinase [Thalassotalea ponticola]MDN3652444.1 serine/threonine protein kinase [Thalassotalea ponticola]
MADFSFQDLSPEFILDALEAHGFYVASGLLPLNSYENRVYQFHDDDRVKYVTKFYRPKRWSTEQIQEEHDFALELADAEVPVVAPLIRDGQSLFCYRDVYFAVFPCRGGRIFEVDNLDQLEWMGRFVGRIHAIGSQKSFVHRPTLSTEEFLIQARATLQTAEISSALQKPFFTVLDQVIDLTVAQYKPGKQIRLHGDCHAGNILWTDAGPHFVDLDDCRTGPALQDLWMMLNGDRQNKLLQLDTLLSGYEEFFSFEYSELSLLESLRSMRLINYMAWLTKRWQDPAFVLNFPWFNTEKYWEEQVLMLKEQHAAMHEPALSLNQGL